MTAEREMTLHEWVGKLPEIHLARKEFVAMQVRIATLGKVAEAAEQLLTHRDNDARVPTRKKEHGLIYKTTACRDDAEILMKKLSALRAAGYLKEQGE